MISFGTSGWRAIIADDFTIQGVRIVSQAIAQYLKTQKNQSKNIVVGYDTRFMSENFGKAAAEVLAANGFTVLYSDTAVPTPVIAYEIIRKKSAGGINITASHNPPQYNGLKFSPSWGGPALPKTTKTIEQNCRIIQKKPSIIKTMPFENALKSKKITTQSFAKSYLTRIEKLVDMDAIRKSKLRIAVDLMHGAGIGYLDRILEENNIPFLAINTNRDCMFGGHHPEPNETHLSTIIGLVKSKKYQIGIGTDGDADRFGIIDSDGSYITPNEILGVLLHHLVTTRKWKGVAARSVMTSSFIDAVAQKHGVELRETPVGFKYIGNILTKEPLIIGGEESGGLTIRGHVPEKDGILACLLAAEMIAMSKQSIRTTINKLYSEVGAFLTTRKNYRLSEQKMQKIKKMLSQKPPKSFAGYNVQKMITIDGYKFVIDKTTWVGFRLSGTEPVLRCYIEASSKQKLTKLLKAAEQMIKK